MCTPLFRAALLRLLVHLIGRGSAASLELEDLEDEWSESAHTRAFIRLTFLFRVYYRLRRLLSISRRYWASKASHCPGFRVSRTLLPPADHLTSSASQTGG